MGYFLLDEPETTDVLCWRSKISASVWFLGVCQAYYVKCLDWRLLNNSFAKSNILNPASVILNSELIDFGEATCRVQDIFSVDTHWLSSHRQQGYICWVSFIQGGRLKTAALRLTLSFSFLCLFPLLCVYSFSWINVLFLGYIILNYTYYS